MMNKLFIDVETKDRGIPNNLGAGWAYRDMLDIIGYSYAINDEPTVWSTDLNLLKKLIQENDMLVAHNAPYEVGMLLKEGFDLSKILVVCTAIYSKLHNSQLMSYSLDKLASKYVGETKYKNELGELAKKLKLVKSKVQDANKIAMANMDILYQFDPTTVIKYANQDVDLCRKLFNVVYTGKHDYMSDLIKLTCKSRIKGVRVDIDKLLKAKYVLNQDMEIENTILQEYLKGRNPRSGLQMAEVCDENNIPYPTTDKGRPSFAKGWSDGIDHPMCHALKRYKTLDKLNNDFILKTISIIEKIEGKSINTLKYGRIHPEMNILGASATGRFSSSKPNIQQLPKHNPLSKKYARGIFIAEQGEKLYCLDFSAQESRVQVHFAHKVGSQQGKEMAEMWSQNPHFDMHTEVAKLVFDVQTVTPEQRKIAKTINLGLSYGMGQSKLAQSLNLKPHQAKILTEKYNLGAPYLKDLTKVAKDIILNRGYLKTLLGRHVYKPPTRTVDDKTQDFSYKAINYLVQGSSADQTMMAMVQAYREGIEVSFAVHDELVISTNDVNKVKRLKEIMETAIPMVVPSVAEVTVGDNFAEQEELVFSEVESVRHNK